MTIINSPLITAEGVLTGVDKYKAMVDIKSKDYTFESLIHIPDDQMDGRARIGSMIGRRVRIEVHLVDDGDEVTHADGHVHYDQLNINDQLFEAAKTGDLDKIDRALFWVERMLEAGATQRAIDRALIWAAENGHQNVVERLKQHIASLGG